MKRSLFFLAVAACLFACKTEPKTATTETEAIEYSVFGDSTIVADGAISQVAMLEKFTTMTDGDSTLVKFSSDINKVCKKKGCWMTLALDDNTESHVTFKDYSFFVPKDADGKTAIVEGMAYKRVVPVDELQHLAEDGGKSPEEIAQITEPEEQYSFEATGVLIKD